MTKPAAHAGAILTAQDTLVLASVDLAGRAATRHGLAGPATGP